MKKRIVIGKSRVVTSKLTRRRAEQISAVEGMKLSPQVGALLDAFEREELSADERRARLLAHFQKKTA